MGYECLDRQNTYGIFTKKEVGGKKGGKQKVHLLVLAILAFGTTGKFDQGGKGGGGGWVESSREIDMEGGTHLQWKLSSLPKKSST